MLWLGEGGRRALLLVLAAVLYAVSCAKPTQADLVGRWALTDGSRQYLPANLRTAAGQVDLVADGTFTAVGLPDMRIESSGRIISTRDGRGTWKILTLGGTDRVELVFADGRGSELQISTSISSGPTLYYFLADPDSGQRLEFVRRP
jgi:hypothetical protein